MKGMTEEQKRVFDIVANHLDFDHIENEIAEKTINKIKESINEDLLINFNDLYKKVTGLVKTLVPRIEKMESKLEKELKKIKSSSSLCEDVYKMRDDLSEAKKELQKFKSAMKRAFD